MNNKTCKLIKRHAADNGYDYRISKKAWNALPKQLRHAERIRMKQDISSNA